MDEPPPPPPPPARADKLTVLPLDILKLFPANVNVCSSVLGRVIVLPLLMVNLSPLKDSDCSEPVLSVVEYPNAVICADEDIVPLGTDVKYDCKSLI